MPIAYLVSEYPATSHTFIRRELTELRRRGLSVATFSVRTPAAESLRGELDQRERAATFYILPVGVADLAADHLQAFARRPRRYLSALRASLGHRLPGPRHGLWALFHFAEAMRLAVALEAEGAEHLHVHFANAASNVGRLAARYLGIGWSVTLHGTADFDYPAGALLPDKLREVTFASCVSYFGRAQAMRALAPDQWDKLLVARCGIELDRLPARTRSRRPQDPVRFVCVGRMSPEKGHLGLLEAFADLLERGVEAALTLVGDGPTRRDVEAQVAARGLGARVRFTGAVPEAQALTLVADADILVQSSLMEGLPVVLMEAMALGLPVIAPAVAGVPELVEDGVSGRLYPASDWAALADRMAELAGSSERWAAMGEAGRAKIESEFAVGPAVEPLLARFRTMSGEPRS